MELRTELAFERAASSPRWRLAGALAGAIAFVAVLALPEAAGLDGPARRAGAVAVLMSIWWISEALPLYATALLPLILFPILGVLDPRAAAAPYAEPTIFLFMGGFFLAAAMQRWELHRRIALYTVRLVGTEPRRLLLGFMVATAAMSMWVSNTATVMMVYPIGLAVIGRFGLTSDGPRGFPVALMLGIAYAASIGGVGTIIGTPPNAILVGQAQLLFPELEPISFLTWMLIGLPYAIVFLPLAWLYLAFVHARGSGPRPDAGAVEREFRTLGPPSRGELGVLAVFVATVLGWITRADLTIGPLTVPGWTRLIGLDGRVSDATVAIAAAVLLFLIPTDLKSGQRLLDWESAVKIPWGVLILFGGGFSLAVGFQETGLAAWLAERLIALEGVPLPLLILSLCLMTTLVGELASNTALAAMMMPILGATAVGMDLHPYLLMIPATLAASSGFMLPVATPPNAIVFGSGVVSIREMARAGLLLNLLGAVLITLITLLVATPVFGLR